MYKDVVKGENLFWTFVGYMFKEKKKKKKTTTTHIET